eukprot:6230065-Alexandrium_andersonii.AAC.1
MNSQPCGPCSRLPVLEAAASYDVGASGCLATVAVASAAAVSAAAGASGCLAAVAVASAAA